MQVSKMVNSEAATLNFSVGIYSNTIYGENDTENVLQCVKFAGFLI